MSYSIQEVVSDGTLVLLDIAIDYFEREDITVYFDEVPNAYDWEWIGTTQRTIEFPTAIPVGVVVLVRRNTDISQPRHIFTLGAKFTAQSLDEDLKQVLQIAQEAKEGGWGESTSELREDLALPSGSTLIGHDPSLGGNTSVYLELLEHAADLAELHSPGGSAVVGYTPTGTGAVAALVQTKLREVVSFRDFGAVGDAVADDTAEVLLALNSGARVVDGQGLTYKLTENIAPTAQNIVIQNAVFDISAITTGGSAIGFTGTQGAGVVLTADTLTSSNAIVVGDTSTFVPDTYAWLASSVVFEGTTGTLLGQIVKIKSVDSGDRKSVV